MKKKILLIAFALSLIAGLIFFITNSKLLITNSKPIHYHAGFLVYIDGQLQDFSDQEYMEISACKIVEQTQTPEEIQIEKAHLHDNVGNVVHVHQKGAVWGDLFKNINFNFPTDGSVIGFINNKLVPNILVDKIRPNESVIIVAMSKKDIIVDDIKGIDLTKYVTVEHIKEVEKKSESCGN